MIQCLNFYLFGLKLKKGLQFDQIVQIRDPKQRKKYPGKLRLIGYWDPDTNKYYTFLTNNFKLAAITIAQIYKARWQIELFFKWLSAVYWRT